MANITITNVDSGNVILESGDFENDLLTFAGAGTVLEGTIIARRAVANAVAAAAGANTGDGTVTLATVAAGPIIPLVGAYVLTITTAVAEGGVFDLVDPNGAIVATSLTMTVGAGAPTVFETAGLQFTVTDGGTDFIVGDTFTLTVAADGKLVPFVKGGDGGAQIPKSVLTFDLTATGAGDEPVRVMISGRVREERLIIDADGDGSNIDATILEQLRDFKITPVNVQELAQLDNQ